MKISTLLLATQLFISSVFSQADMISDSLLLETCKTIVNSKKANDSLKIDEAFNLHLGPVFSTMKDPEFTTTYSYVFVRLQKFCPEFKKYLDEKSPPKDDWTALEAKPATKMEKSSCRGFLDHKNYYYIEQNGDTVKLSLDDGFWVDHFKNGSYSKLKLNWIGDCEFEITFIESSNAVRRSLSKPGEKYKYLLIEKFPGYYLVCLDMREVSILGTFRIYYN